MSVFQIHTGEGAYFPRIPVVYLEAGFALLKAKRYCDALVVCEEVITSTLDFIPERLLLDADEKLKGADSDVVLENVDLVLWAGAAHLLQAQAHWKLKDTKEAITNFTRYNVSTCFIRYLAVLANHGFFSYVLILSFQSD